MKRERSLNATQRSAHRFVKGWCYRSSIWGGLVIAAISMLFLPTDARAASTQRTDLSARLKRFTPEGYKVEKTMAWDPYEGEHLAALSNASDLQINSKPVILLLVSVGKKVVVEDSVTPHNDTQTTEFWKGPPNYFRGMTRENVGAGDLFLVRTVLSAGGSGSLHYFDFYQVDKKKLRLIKSFSHGRMEQTYFAVYKNAIYDAEPVCTRGEKHGKAYIYTCYLQVTKFTFDGQAIRSVGSERLREQRGNRYLQDKYWFMSVLKALQAKEIFGQSP